MKVTVIDFVTSYGGTQRVMVNVLEQWKQSSAIEASFIDAYDEPKTRQKMIEAGVRIIDMPVGGPNRLDWAKCRWRALAAWGLLYMCYTVRLWRCIRHEKTDVIYTNSAKGALISCLVAALAGRPYVFHAHGFRNTKDICGAFKWAVKRAEAVIAVSQDVKMKLMAAGIDERRIVVIYNALSLKKWSYLPQRENFSRDLKVMLAASLQPAKGIHTAIEAIRLLAERNIAVELTIYGEAVSAEDEKYAGELERAVEEAGLANCINFAGWCDDISAALAQHDLLLLPSYWESFGMTIVEAMASGRAVIATRTGGIPEVVEEGISGRLFSPGAALELAEILTEFETNRNLVYEYGQYGRERVERLFTIERQSAEICEVLFALRQCKEGGPGD